ncbi:3-keto-disaccharide hydrolase [Salegentibacter sp. F14]
MNKITVQFSFSVFFVFLVIACGQNAKDKDTPWQDITPEKGLKGWEVKGGEAEYRLENNTVIGKTVHGTANTFLSTEKNYDDFILKLEFKVHPSMNSGIQIRSNSIHSYMDGRVHGYQVEIDPSDRAWSGGIYDEARRGWLVNLEGNPEAQQAFKQDEWNTYRVEAIGDTIKTWVNSVPAAHLIDEKTASGFIALQVHSINEDSEEGTEISWRNIKILTEDLEEYSKESPLEPVITKNQLTKSEAEVGWEMLWNGESTEGWRGAKLEEFPEEGWEIENGVLTVLASGGEESAAGGDIVTKKLYSDFELKLDFKITEGANSGIKYFVDTGLNKGDGSAIGLEYQILDDERHPDAKKGNHEGSRTMASLYDLIQAHPDKPVNPIREWNTARIISEGNHVEHWLNGEKVLEYERKTEEFRKLIAESKYEDWPNFGELEEGHLLLQDHGNRVSFKNIKIKTSQYEQ